MQTDGLRLLRISCPTREEMNSVSPRFVEFFESHLNELFGPDGQSIYRNLYHGLRDACSPESNSARVRLLENFEKLLNDGRPLAKDVVGSMSFVFPDDFRSHAKDQEGQRLLTALSNYSMAQGDNLSSAMSAEISSVRSSIYRRFPYLVPIPPANALWVGHPWIAAGNSPVKPWSSVLFDAESALWHNGRLWLTDPSGRRLWRIDPATFQSELFEGTNGPNPPYDSNVLSGWNNVGIPSKRPAFAGGKIYLPESGDIWVYTPESNSWARLGLPSSNYSLWNVGDDLFTSFGEEKDKIERRRGEGAGVYRINTSNDSAALLFSTRRRPPLHPLDGIACERPFCIFPDRNGNPIVGLLTKPWSSLRRLDSGEEWNGIDPRGIANFTSVSGETLFIDNTYTERRHILQSVQRVDRRGHREVLLWNPDNPSQPPEHPVWTFPEELLKTTKISGLGRLYYRAAMSGDDLYLFVCEMFGAPSGTPKDDLYIFRRGQKEPKMFPLAFDISRTEEGIIRKSYNRIDAFKYPMPSNHGFLAVDSGLVIVVYGTGFWFIPFADIEAAIQKTALPGASPKQN